MTAHGSFLDQFGSLDFVVVEFADGAPRAGGFRALIELERGGVLRVLDLEFVARAEDGSARRVPATGLPTVAGLDLAALHGVGSGLLDDEDLTAAAANLPVGGLAAVVIYEHLSLLPVLETWRAEGATIGAEGPVAAEDLEAALDATESTQIKER